MVGKVKEIKEDKCIVFWYLQDGEHPANIKENGNMQVAIVSTTSGSKGYRLVGKACVDGQDVLFKAEKAEALL